MEIMILSMGMNMTETEKIKSPIVKTDTGNDLTKKDSFLLQEINNYTGLLTDAGRKSDRYNALYCALTTAIFLVILLMRILIPEIILEGKLSRLFLLLFSCSYLYGLFTFIILIRSDKSQSHYSQIIHSLRLYFLETTGIEKPLEEVYYRNIKFLKNQGKEFARLGIFFFVNFINGVLMTYFLFKNMTIPGSDSLSLVLCVLISIFLSYIYYFWYRTSIESTAEKTGLL